MVAMVVTAALVAATCGAPSGSPTVFAAVSAMAAVMIVTFAELVDLYTDAAASREGGFQARGPFHCGPKLCPQTLPDLGWRRRQPHADAVFCGAKGKLHSGDHFKGQELGTHCGQ